MKHYRKSAAFAAGLLIALSACMPSFTAFAEEPEDEDSYVMIDDDGNIIGKEKIDENDIITSGDYKYTENEDGTVSVLNCGNGGETFTLPVEIDGKKVSHIDGGAFLELNAKKIVIPAGVDYDLTENPFASCILLEEFEVEEGNNTLCSVDNVLFSKDRKKLISFPAASKKTAYTIPEGTETIGVAAFYESKLENITVPACVTELERHCFSSMQNLKTADLSEASVTEIPPMAFVSSASLNEIKFPEKLEKIEIAAFMDCSSLEKITLPETLTYVGQSAFQGTAMTKVIIPKSVNKIGYNAFGYKDEETAVEGFTVIGVPNSEAQTYCTDGDSEYDYQNNFTFVTKDDYDDQNALNGMDLKSSGDFMYSVDGDEAVLILCDCAKDSVVVPDNFDGYKVTSVYKEAFQSCISKDITLPDTVKTIGKQVFNNHVVNLTLPGDLEVIEEDEPFIDCTNLKTITVKDGNGNYSSENGILYSKDKTKLIVCPQSYEEINVIIPSTVKEIAISGFCYNKKIGSVEMPSVENIGDFAFEGCTALKNVKFSENLKSVGKCAFLGCTSLKSVRIYNTLESISEYAFGYDYDDDLAIKMSEDPDKYKDEDGNFPKAYSLTKHFRMYVDKGSVAEKYATDCGIETVTESATIGKTNVDLRILYLLGGVLGVGVLALLIKLISGKVKKSKKAKKQ